MSVSTVSSQNSETRPSPFAAPEVCSHDATCFLPEGASYRVHADELYCRNDADLSGICWMTGDAQGLVGSGCFVSPLGLMPLLAILMSPVVSLVTLGILNRFTSWGLGLSVIVIAAGAGLFTHAVLNSMRKNFRLHYGVSEAARKARGRETASRWISRFWTGACVAVALRLSGVGSGTAPDLSVIMLRLLGLLAAWGGIALVIHAVLRPRFFRPHIERRPDDVFCVKGLTPEFLHAVSRAATGHPAEQRW